MTKRWDADSNKIAPSATSKLMSVDEEGGLRHVLPNELQAYVQAKIFGTIAHDAVAPTPGETGEYTFSTGGVCAWLDMFPDTNTVTAGDTVKVIYNVLLDAYSYELVPNDGSYATVGELADETAARALADSAFYAKAIEPIAFDATAPTPDIPIGTTKTYEFITGGTVSWLSNQVVEIYDSTEITRTGASAWTRILKKSKFVEVQDVTTDIQDKYDFNGCVEAFYSLTELAENERLVIYYFARVSTTNTFQLILKKFNTVTLAESVIATHAGLTYNFDEVAEIYSDSTKTVIVGYIYANLSKYTGHVVDVGQGNVRLPYALPLAFDYLAQPLLSNYFIDNRLTNIETELQNIDSSQPLINIWGDSITWGSASSATNNCYTAILRQLLIDNGYSEGVVNCGVGGENFHNILVRHGAFGFYLSDDVILPANTTEKVSIQTTTNWINNRKFRNTYHGTDSYFSLLLQGEVGRDNQQDAYKTVNPLSINGVEVVMTLEGTQENNNIYLSPKENQSSPVTIKAGTLIQPHGNTFKSKVEVFSIGTNGGFIVKNDNVLDLTASINQYIEMIEIARQKSNSYFIVCSPYGGTALDELGVVGLQELESELSKKYGTRFFNWREYLVNYGLLDAGITPSEADETAIAQGLVPPSLLSDVLHPNDAGHLVLGRKLFNILKACGYITLKN